ncbi:hypothetical protein C8P67_102413 [Flavobacterium aquicola]|uniref:Uncharacterized protein n=1 Tax=Flavobacterium aquicola TaxID=1682742 RepID=A0A3E0ETN5_9FLAO|nr:hypothetical protein C8P67_102413 [Flavobacterium aquicola]
MLLILRLMATNTKGCQKTKEFTVNLSTIATIANITFKYFSEDENYVTPILFWSNGS